MKYFTGILINRKMGLETYTVVVRNVVAHEFLSPNAARDKLNWYRNQLGDVA